MPRTARIVIPKYPYHVTQRGNYRQEIFQEEEDRLKYLSWIDEYSKKYQMSIYAYCLMSNHVHFICMPYKKDSLARVFSSVHMRYSQYFNRKKKAAGHLWQGRFYSCVLEDSHVYAAVRYVERNPVRANLVKQPWEWEWSSASCHVEKTRESKVNLGEMSDIMDIEGINWKDYIKEKEDPKEIDQMRKCTMLGRPWGGSEFIATLSKVLGISLDTRRRGRPKKRK
jgi:putative transposase